MQYFLCLEVCCLPFLFWIVLSCSRCLSIRIQIPINVVTPFIFLMYEFIIETICESRVWTLKSFENLSNRWKLVWKIVMGRYWSCESRPSFQKNKNTYTKISKWSLLERGLCTHSMALQVQLQIRDIILQMNSWIWTNF